MKNRSLILLAILVLTGCQSLPSAENHTPDDHLEQATFAGGCFWAMQPPFDDIDGVHTVQVGFTGGEIPYPTFHEVVRGTTSYLEVVDIHFDPDVVSYEELLTVFWRNIDPTDDNGQFADRGPNYRTAIFYHSEDQLRSAEASRDDLDASGRFHAPLVTDIRPGEEFWAAGTYHQNYYKKKPDHFNRYYPASGRLSFIEEVWAR